MSARSLSALAAAVVSLPDPRSKQGVSHPYIKQFRRVFTRYDELDKKDVSFAVDELR